MRKKNLIDLAKSSTTTAKKPITKKTVIKKPIEKKLTSEEERKLKALETVNKLLEDSPITNLNKKEELLEINQTPVEEPKGIEWLEEQVTLLSEKNEALSAELTLSKEDYKRLMIDVQQGRINTIDGSDGDIKIAVLQLFNELQENHIKLGVNQEGIGNFRIYCPGFLNRMIKFFPFLEEVKRY
jgi:hypothetical protein